MSLPEILVESSTATHILSILELLAIDLQIPGQSALKERFVFSVFKIQFPVFVTLVIRSTVDNRLYILPTQNEDTRDDRVICLPEDTHGSKEILARSLQSVEEATDLVGGHKDESKFFVIFEVDAINGEPFFVEAMS